jgi:hypothetical protein
MFGSSIAKKDPLAIPFTAFVKCEARPETTRSAEVINPPVMSIVPDRFCQEVHREKREMYLPL